MVVQPPMLQAGDTFGIVTLGSPLDPTEIDERISFLKEHGFKVVIGDYVYASDGYLAGTDQQRASDLMRMYKDPEVKAILPTRGGVGVEGILPYLDYRYIANHPKIISGYSDITILLNVLYPTKSPFTACCCLTSETVRRSIILHSTSKRLPPRWRRGKLSIHPICR